MRTTKTLKSKLSKLFGWRKPSKAVKEHTNDDEVKTEYGSSKEISPSGSVGSHASHPSNTAVKIDDTWLPAMQLQAMAESLGKAKETDSICSTDDKVAIVHEFMVRWNAYDLNGAKQLTTQDSEWYFYDQLKLQDAVMSWDALAVEVSHIFASFPDFLFQYETVGYTGASRASEVVVVPYLQSSGTHTGAPYALGPCEAIEAAGKKVLNDPEEFYFFFHGDKIARICVCPKGEMTGPPGLYTQIGGFPGM